MSEPLKLEELRRRVEQDPASVAFATLGEEYRKLGRWTEAVVTCRNGLRRHSGYVSARVTLARALAEMGQEDAAKAEFERVLKTAPDNLLARKGLATILRRRGQFAAALEHLKAATAFAPQDAELRESIWAVQESIWAIEAQLGEAEAAGAEEGGTETHEGAFPPVEVADALGPLAAPIQIIDLLADDPLPWEFSLAETAAHGPPPPGVSLDDGWPDISVDVSAEPVASAEWPFAGEDRALARQLTALQAMLGAIQRTRVSRQSL